MNLSESLFEQMQEIIPPAVYPQGHIVPVNKQVSETAFFPLGEGILEPGKWKQDEHYPVMVLAQDCGNKEAMDLQDSLVYGHPVWLSIEKLLGKDVMKDCFFTTAIMGLRVGDKKPQAASFAFTPTAKKFLEANHAFFREQLETVDPDVIIALGLPVVHFLSAIFVKELGHLKDIKSNAGLLKACPKGYLDLLLDGNPLRIVLVSRF